MTQWNFGVYVMVLRAWLASHQNLTISQAVEYAIETAAALAHIDMSSPFGALVLSLVEGLILSPVHHDGNNGPITTPAQAVALAIQTATDHGSVPLTWDSPVIEKQ